MKQIHPRAIGEGNNQSWVKSTKQKQELYKERNKAEGRSWRKSIK